MPSWLTDRLGTRVYVMVNSGKVWLELVDDVEDRRDFKSAELTPDEARAVGFALIEASDIARESKGPGTFDVDI